MASQAAGRWLVNRIRSGLGDKKFQAQSFFQGKMVSLSKGPAVGRQAQGVHIPIRQGFVDQHQDIHGGNIEQNGDLMAFNGLDHLDHLEAFRITRFAQVDKGYNWPFNPAT